MLLNYLKRKFNINNDTLRHKFHGLYTILWKTKKCEKMMKNHRVQDDFQWRTRKRAPNSMFIMFQKCSIKMYSDCGGLVKCGWNFKWENRTWCALFLVLIQGFNLPFYNLWQVRWFEQFSAETHQHTTNIPGSENILPHSLLVSISLLFVTATTLWI